MAALLWGRLLCTGCDVAHKCVDPCTSGEPRSIECPACDGTGSDFSSRSGAIKPCGHCLGSNPPGRFDLSTCPKQFARPMGELLDLAAMWEQGIPPIAGGSLDQANWIFEACRFLWRDQQEIRNELESKV